MHRKSLIFVHVAGDVYIKEMFSIHVIAVMCTKLLFLSISQIWGEHDQCALVFPSKLYKASLT